MVLMVRYYPSDYKDEPSFDTLYQLQEKGVHCYQSILYDY